MQLGEGGAAGAQRLQRREAVCGRELAELEQALEEHPKTYGSSGTDVENAVERVAGVMRTNNWHLRRRLNPRSM